MTKRPETPSADQTKTLNEDRLDNVQGGFSIRAGSSGDPVGVKKIERKTPESMNDNVAAS